MLCNYFCAVLKYVKNFEWIKILYYNFSVFLQSNQLLLRNLINPTKNRNISVSKSQIIIDALKFFQYLVNHYYYLCCLQCKKYFPKCEMCHFKQYLYIGKFLLCLHSLSVGSQVFFWYYQYLEILLLTYYLFLLICKWNLFKIQSRRFLKM